MFEEKIVKKVPGDLCPNPREKQGYIENLNLKTKAELQELVERQNKLLANKSFLSKLPDKGERIKTFRESLLAELSQRDQVEQTCGLLSNLTLSKKNVNDEIEWNGTCTKAAESNSSCDDGSDEEKDPLKLLASNASLATRKKKNRLLKQEYLKNGEALKVFTLNEEDDLSGQKSESEGKPPTKQDADGSSEIKPCEEPYAKTLCEKIDKPPPPQRKEPFRPHCTTKSGVHPGLHTPKHLGPHWEVTAATPPPPVHGATKLLSLNESLHLQQEQAAKLKDIQAKHATERLAAHTSHKLGSTLPDISVRNEYRDTQQTYDSCNSSDEEETYAQSDGEDDKRDTIVYTYTE